MPVELCNGEEIISYITPVTKEKIRARINWIDEDEKEFGITYVQNKCYVGAHNILKFGDKGERFTFE